jgi:glucans biosynthesis protein
LLSTAESTSWSFGHRLITRASGAIVAVCLGGYGPESLANAEDGFDYASVCQVARSAATHPYDDPDDCPPVLARLSYDQYRQLRFTPDRAIWKGQGLGYEVQLFHRGYLFPRRVGIDLVEDGRVTPLAYDRSWFTFPPEVDPAAWPESLGFAGFRIHYPLNRPDYADEFAVFLGSSYFRAVGAGQVYGASCRGLAVDIALPTPEQFPRFQRFWLVRPVRGAPGLTAYALLDDKCLTGAYRFEISPGQTTRIEVTATLYGRRAVRKLALAPITSMFYSGTTTTRPAGDFRPEVHDSDGLMVTGGAGSTSWRPLMNPDRTQVTQWPVGALGRFGLVQRERGFDRYLDREALYHRRPSVWVEPVGDWPEGVVELLEIPTRTEAADNINAYWVAADSAIPQGGRHFRYRVSMTLADEPGGTWR